MYFLFDGYYEEPLTSDTVYLALLGISFGDTPVLVAGLLLQYHGEEKGQNGGMVGVSSLHSHGGSPHLWCGLQQIEQECKKVILCESMSTFEKHWIHLDHLWG